VAKSHDTKKVREAKVSIQQMESIQILQSRLTSAAVPPAGKAMYGKHFPLECGILHVQHAASSTSKLHNDKSLLSSIICCMRHFQDKITCFVLLPTPVKKMSARTRVTLLYEFKLINDIATRMMTMTMTIMTIVQIMFMHIPFSAYVDVPSWKMSSVVPSRTELECVLYFELLSACERHHTGVSDRYLRTRYLRKRSAEF